jgi:hypothetical protein
MVNGPEHADLLPEGAEVQGFPVPSLDTVVESAGNISEDVGAITKAARQALVGKNNENKLDEAMTSFVELTKELRSLTESLNRVVTRFDRATRPKTPAPRGELDPPADSKGGNTTGLCAANDTGPCAAPQKSGAPAPPPVPEDPIAQSVDNTNEAAASLKRSADALEDLVNSIKDGNGTLGRLTTDPETTKKFDETLDAIHNSAKSLENASTLGGIHARIGFRADYLINHKAESYLELILRKQANFFQLQAIGVGATNTFTMSALLGHRFAPVAVRVGLIRATPGMASDLYLLSDRFRLTAEVWDFERKVGPPRARLESAIYPVPNVFLIGGWDDFLLTSRGNDAFFLGAGFHFGE